VKNLKTTFTALVTPFRDGKVDFESLSKLIEQQLAAGVGGFVVNGTTAESPTLEWSEVVEIFNFTKARVGKSIPLIVGTGSNSTKKTIEISQKAEALGADALLVVVPYYNKPPQRGLVAHFEAVASSVGVPVLLYNVPSRTISSLSIESIQKLSQHKNIIGIKEASGNIEFAKEIIKSCGKEFIMLSGDDGTYAEFLQAGGHGVISVASHIIPKAFVSLIESQGLDVSYKSYLPLINLLFCEANPIPVKKALQLMNIIGSAELRLPLCELEELNALKLRGELEKVGLL
jgi:4-hydroxy-tetrahydrodipicolinate synthase